VYAGGEASTYIRIPSVTLGGVLYEGLTPARFVKELEPGKRYTLTLAFKNLQFAGSNIYWKAVASGPQAPGYLTFDGVGETAHQMYQGVFFMWGSLVGISPAGDHGVAVNSTSKIYVPTFNSGSNPTWATDDDLLANVPFVKDIFPGDFLDPSGTYLMDNDRNTSTCWNDKKGDICRYISENGYGPGGNYRLPTGYELGTPMGITTYIVLDYGTSGWTRIGTTWAGSGNYTSVPSTYGDGTFLISCGASNNGFVFPASGNKLATTTNNGGGDSYLSNVNGSGFYWSGTARGTFDPPYFPVTYYMAYIISISYANVYIQGDPYWILGQSDVPVYPVRCIKY
jgi:hypothetical protein